MTNLTAGQRVIRNADNANGTVREITPDGVIVDMDHGTDVLGAPDAFRPESPITDAERKAAEDSWPTLTAADLDNVKLPKGMVEVVTGWPSVQADQVQDGEILPDGVKARAVEIRWTIAEPIAYGDRSEFVHRIIARDEADARRQLAASFLTPGTRASVIRILAVRSLV